MFLTDYECGILHNLIEDLIYERLDISDNDTLTADLKTRYGYDPDDVAKLVNSISEEAGYDEVFE